MQALLGKLFLFYSYTLRYATGEVVATTHEDTEKAEDIDSADTDEITDSIDALEDLRRRYQEMSRSGNVAKDRRLLPTSGRFYGSRATER